MMKMQNNITTKHLKPNKMEQTAVEWLINQYEQKLGKSISIVMSDEIATANQMFEEQITDAYIEGGIKGFNFFGDDYEQYYNETFKNK